MASPSHTLQSAVALQTEPVLLVVHFGEGSISTATDSPCTSLIAGQHPFREHMLSNDLNSLSGCPKPALHTSCT